MKMRGWETLIKSNLIELVASEEYAKANVLAAPGIRDIPTTT